MRVLPISPADPMFDQLGDLFDAYRAHYGRPRSPDATRRWLREQVGRRRLRVAAAIGTDQVCGLITTAIMPASLTLRTVWLIRDLYVDPAHRRRGIARTLLQHVIDAARADGAHRLSLQTETGNTAALGLYLAGGFRPVGGLELLNLPLSSDDDPLPPGAGTAKSAPPGGPGVLGEA